jgi:5-methylthioribose kinase
MRALNHEHIFRVPLAGGNGLPLDDYEPGLAKAAAELRGDADYCAIVAESGERYLADGSCLVHGDYFPGSWLRTERGLRVIDPEFAFPGDPEVDVGCALAHLALARQPAAVAERLQKSYVGDGEARLDPKWLARFAAVEVMRRLIGVAQLPLAGAPGSRAQLLERARRAMMEGCVEALWA